MEKILTLVYKNRKLALALTVTCHALSVIFVLALGAVLGVFVYRAEYASALILAVSLAVGFVALTLLRALLDAPRPYELYGFYEVKPKKRSGKSFPSRHAYSAFAISLALFSVNLPFAIILTALSLIMCISRVLLGIHFIRDVAAGGLIGVLAGAMGLILI